MTKISEVTNKSTRSPVGKKGPSRRALLKAGGALLGGAAGAGAVTGFPTIWAQEMLILSSFFDFKFKTEFKMR